MGGGDDGVSAGGWPSDGGDPGLLQYVEDNGASESHTLGVMGDAAAVEVVAALFTCREGKLSAKDGLLIDDFLEPRQPGVPVVHDALHVYA